MAGAVFLDRDGVLNKAFVRDGRPYPPRRAEEFEVLDGAADACETFRRNGLVVVVVTNQPDIARGDLTLADLSAIHEALKSRIPVDGVLFCPHTDSDCCGCRKPAPGLLLDGAARWGVDLGHSVMVGDRWRDVEAGRRAGCRTVFIDRGYDEPGPAGPDLTVSELSDAVPWILAACADDQGVM